MVFWLSIAFATAGEPDARRPFYVIAHCANDSVAVHDAMAAGANAVEIDVVMRHGHLRGLHGGLEPIGCGGRTRPAELPALFEQVAEAMGDGHLALLVVDAKEADGQEVAYGRALGRLLGEVSVPPANVVVSVPFRQGERVRQGLLDVSYRARLDVYLSNYGVTDPAQWMGDLQALGVDVAGVGMDPIAFWRPMRWWGTWLDLMVAHRDAGTGPGFAYYWTVNRIASAREVLDRGLDGVITNHPRRVVALLDDEPYRHAFRLATAQEGVP